MVVIINPFERTETVIVNDVELLRKYHAENKQKIWCGFNTRHYDQYILKGLLCGFDAWEVNDWIINKGLPGYQFSNLLNKIPFRIKNDFLF